MSCTEEYDQSVLLFFMGGFLRLHGGQYLSNDEIISAVQDVFVSFADAVNLTTLDAGGFDIGVGVDNEEGAVAYREEG